MNIQLHSRTLHSDYPTAFIEASDKSRVCGRRQPWSPTSWTGIHAETAAPPCSL